MTVYHLAAGSTPTAPPPPTQRLREPIPHLALESMDGTRRIRLDGSMGWILMKGATGLEMAAPTLHRRRIPGVHGSIPAGFRVPERRVFLPLYGRGNSQREYRKLKSDFVDLIDPHTGSFKLVASTVVDTRELICEYEGGLEGDDAAMLAGLDWSRVGLRLVASQPFARSRAERRLVFRTADAGDRPFIGVVGGTDAPWPGTLSNSAVIGEGMEVIITSEVPVHPRLDLVGPMDSFSSEMAPVKDTTGSRSWNVDIPAGVPEGSTFTLITSGTEKSIRLDGELAAGRVALGSTLRPFQPGTNIFNVVAPGGSSETRIIITWHDLYWSLW